MDDVTLLDLEGIMRTEQGRRILRLILERSGFFESSFNQSDRVTAFNEGKRDIALWLYENMRQANQGHLLTIIKDHNNG
jgi:hypothetical protein